MPQIEDHLPVRGHAGLGEAGLLPVTRQDVEQLTRQDASDQVSARWTAATSMTALLSVKGIGARKADDLGEIFLAAIRAHAT